MTTKIMKYLLAVTAMLLVVIIGSIRPVYSGAGPSVNDNAPDFSLRDLNGEIRKLSDLRGKVVLINFWASWCPQCRNEIPGFEKIYQSNKGKGFFIIGIAMDDVTLSTLKQLQLTYPVVKADDKVVKDYGGIKGIPTSFLVGRDGRIIKKIRGEYTENALRTDLENALKK